MHAHLSFNVFQFHKALTSPNDRKKRGGCHVSDRK
jgi:hypothetical protein